VYSCETSEQLEELESLSVEESSEVSERSREDPIFVEVKIHYHSSLSDAQKQQIRNEFSSHPDVQMFGITSCSAKYGVQETWTLNYMTQSEFYMVTVSLGYGNNVNTLLGQSNSDDNEPQGDQDFELFYDEGC
jgi:hypothetical protein